MNEAQLLKLVARVYDASIDPGGWSHFLEGFAEHMDRGGVALVRHPAYPGREIQTVALGYDPAYLESWQQHYYQLDPGFEISRNTPVGKARFDDVPLAERSSSEFYADWLEPQGLGGSPSFGINVDITDYGTTMLGVYPSRGGREPGAAEITLLQAVTPHLRRALQVSDLWRQSDHERNALGQALDLLPTAVVLVDARHRVRRINQAAGALLRLRDGLSIERGELRAATPALTAALHRQIDRARRTATGEVAPAPFALVLGRPSGLRALEALVTPVGERGQFVLEPDVVAAIFVRDPLLTPRFAPKTLRELYGFTPAESRLAQELVAGSTLAEAAASLGVTVGTLRNRLKTLFKKTGTHRQADLVRRLTLGPAGLTPGEPRGKG